MRCLVNATPPGPGSCNPLIVIGGPAPQVSSCLGIMLRKPRFRMSDDRPADGCREFRAAVSEMLDRWEPAGFEYEDEYTENAQIGSHGMSPTDLHGVLPCGHSTWVGLCGPTCHRSSAGSQSGGDEAGKLTGVSVAYQPQLPRNPIRLLMFSGVRLARRCNASASRSSASRSASISALLA